MTSLIHKLPLAHRLHRPGARRALALYALVLYALLALPGAGLPGAAAAAPPDQLVSMINDYRAAPARCDGRDVAALAPLAPHPALARLRITTGTFLELALERLGYHAQQADAIVIVGADSARDAMDTIKERYCRNLLSGDFSAIGIARIGTDWQIVLAQSTLPLSLPAWPDAGKEILAAVNRARSSSRSCGERVFPAAAPLVWNDQLGNTALAHSEDMTVQKYFAHQAKDGSTVGTRATRAGYRWRIIGENIASGQTTPAEAVEGWLASPGHCVNIMEPAFTEMGAAYAIRKDRYPGRVYWTQAFGTPR